MDFPAWLRQKMEEHRLNQPGLAEQIGVSQSTVSLWLNGKAEPGLDKLEAIARVFGYDAGTLLQILGIIEPATELSPAMAARMERIEQLLSSIGDERVREIVIAKLDSSFAETIDLVERIQDLLNEDFLPPA